MNLQRILEHFPLLIGGANDAGVRVDWKRLLEILIFLAATGFVTDQVLGSRFDSLSQQVSRLSQRQDSLQVEVEQDLMQRADHHVN